MAAGPLAVEEQMVAVFTEGDTPRLHQFQHREEGCNHFAAVAGGEQVVVSGLTGAVQPP